MDHLGVTFHAQKGRLIKDCKEKAIFMTFYFLTTFQGLKAKKRYFKGQKRYLEPILALLGFLKDVHENETSLFGVSVCLPTP